MARPIPEIMTMFDRLLASPSVSSTAPEWDEGNRGVIELLAEWLDALVESAIPKAGGWNYSRPRGYLSAANTASTISSSRVSLPERPAGGRSSTW